MTLIVALAACERASEEGASSDDAAVPDTVRYCGDDGHLSTELHGSIERDLRWDSSQLHCESMRRPDGKGIRLRFTGEVGQDRIAIILALPGLERGQTGAEIPTVVTFMVEGSGRFFSTPNLDSCWSDIARQDILTHATDRYDLAGTLYCVTPLGEINGDAAISIPELAFRAIIDWSAT